MSKHVVRGYDIVKSEGKSIYAERKGLRKGAVAETGNEEQRTPETSPSVINFQITNNKSQIMTKFKISRFKTFEFSPWSLFVI
jgi:hypothetical protein